MKRRFTSAQTEPKIAVSTQTLISVPFCRDPTQPVPKLPPDEPAPPIPKTTGKDGLGNRPAVYKKKPAPYAPQNYYQPPVPWSGARDDTDILENSSGKLKKTNYSRSLYAIDAPDMQNPIKELQALAKSTSDMNDDDPPFNFQAMLKKTPRNRASMKRSGETDNSTLEGRFERHVSPSPVAKRTAPSPVGHSPAVGDRITPGSGKVTPTGVRSPAPTPPPPRPRSKELIRKDSKELIMAALKKRDSKTDLICSVMNECERVEIAPGITVEGVVTDL